MSDRSDVRRHLSLIAILDPRNVQDATAACRDAVAGGVSAIQVRMKDAPAADILAATRTVMESVDVPVYVNDRADVAWAAGAAGVHLGWDDLPVDAVRRLSRRVLSIGISVGNHHEATRALESRADYWSMGSVFKTGSKPDAGAPIGLSGLIALLNRAPHGVAKVAIGGINADNVAGVMATGVDGVAVVSAIFGASDIREAARRIRDAIDGS